MKSKLTVELIEHTPDPEKVIATAAKLCYSPSNIKDLMEKQTPEAVESFLNRLMSMGHESPIEHVSFTFAIEGVSRITEIQLVRHRIASYSIQSGRYVNRSNPEFVTPPSIKKSKVANERYEKIVKESIEAYNDLFLILMLRKMGYSDNQIENMDIDWRIKLVSGFQNTNKKSYQIFEKEAIQDARYAHLQSLSTRIVVTMNARSLINFFNHRCCMRAQWEIRQMAQIMLKKCKQIAPTLFKNSGPKCLYDKCPEGNLTCGKSKEIKKLFDNL